MNINLLSIAIASYLTGAVIVYAYLNRNPYIDLALASISIFAFGTSMLLGAFNILLGVQQLLQSIAILSAVSAVIFLAARIALGVYKAVRKYFRM